MEDKKKILHARSKEDGIVFYSNKVPVMCYEATLDDEGEIYVRPQPRSWWEEEDYCGMFVPDIRGLQKKLSKYLKIALFILAILSIVITKNVIIAFGLTYFSLLAAEELVELGILAYEIKFGSLKQTGRFHSAEHMAIAAYTKHQRIPTMEEIKEASHFDKECHGKIIIRQVVFVLLLTLIICFYAYLPLFVYFGLIGILLILAVIERKYNFLRVFQVLLTNKPTDKELEVALAGIELFDKLEAKIPEEDIPIGMIIVEICSPEDDEHDA